MLLVLVSLLSVMGWLGLSGLFLRLLATCDQRESIGERLKDGK